MNINASLVRVGTWSLQKRRMGMTSNIISLRIETAWILLADFNFCFL